MLSLLITGEKFWQLSWRNVRSSTQCKCGIATLLQILKCVLNRRYLNTVLRCTCRSPPVDQQNSASTVASFPGRVVSKITLGNGNEATSTVETDQPEDPAVVTKRVGTKRARMMPGEKIVLPSSDVYEYTGNILQGTISRVLNCEGMILLAIGRNFFAFLVGLRGYASSNRPSWWPKDVAFSPLSGMLVRSSQ